MKYKVEKLDGTPIPADEPVFVLRAKDVLAVNVLRAYLISYRSAKDTSSGFFPSPESLFDSEISEIIEMFIAFANDNPDKMKLPD